MGEGGKIGWWPLMDEFMDLVGCERTYFGRVPRDLQKTWDCISMVGGMNGVNLKHRAESLQTRRRSGRYRKFVERTTMTMDSLVLGAPTMLPMRDPLMWRLYDEAAPTETLPVLEHAVLEGINNKAYASALPASARRSMRKSLTTVDLLTQFRSQYTINEPMLKFPLLLLHLQAQRMLVYLRSRLLPTMTSHAPINHINVLDHELKDVAWHILKTVCNDAFTLRFTGIKDPEKEIDMAWQMLREAKMFIKRLVAEHAKGPTRCGIPGCTCTGGPGFYDLDDMREGRVFHFSSSLPPFVSRPR
ncbi:hypothetical protein BCR44DRAFT_1431944 [Catenaria anguillulae PL171]|uniref:Uncharacterized protein n=1 Tax=Catenaria anguillulae PL171 TaxID=765915 RepID=A0A1Y2HQL8_9FUNG|nr:hypothetical protein BCR44DRAFT_1431944 [Catenaria anguillulae PL171]